MPFEDPVLRNLLTKIKKCQYTIPDFVSEPVRDLIEKMLQINPAERISISEIKKHPAFRIGLMNDYSLPQPFPIPHFENPIDISTIQDSILRSIQRLGYYSSEELIHDLTDSSPSMAKVFFFMMTSQFSITQLPWNNSNSFTESFYEKSNDLNYLMEEDTCIENEQEVEISSLNIALNVLFLKLQNWAKKYNMEWFYPNDFQMMCYDRKKCYILFNVYNDEESTFTLLIRVEKASKEDFHQIFQNIQTILKSNITHELELTQIHLSENDEDY